jgi:hypothetical protein
MCEYMSTIKLCSSCKRTSSTAHRTGDRNGVQMLKITTRSIHIFTYLRKILQGKKTYMPNDEQPDSAVKQC